MARGSRRRLVQCTDSRVLKVLRQAGCMAQKAAASAAALLETVDGR